VFSRRIILIRWVSAIEFASTRVVILTTWIAAIEFAYGALNMPLALRLDHGPDPKPPCRPDHVEEKSIGQNDQLKEIQLLEWSRRPRASEIGEFRLLLSS